MYIFGRFVYYIFIFLFISVQFYSINSIFKLQTHIRFLSKNKKNKLFISCSEKVQKYNYNEKKYAFTWVFCTSDDF